MMARVEKFVLALSRWFNWIACVTAVAMLLLVCSDIVGVKLFKTPVPGAIEVVGFLGVIVIACGMAYTLAVKGHIAIDFFLNKLSTRTRAGFEAFISLFNCALFAVLSWQSWVFGMVLQRTGEVSMTERIPFYYIVYALALTCVPVCLVSIFNLGRSLKRVVQQ
jgi:TRAP-type C4-dicarboxylate transport system permease small subunit